MDWQAFAALVYGSVAGLIGGVALRRRGGPRGYVAAISTGLALIVLIFLTRNSISDDARATLARVLLLGMVLAAAIGGAVLFAFLRQGRRTG